MPQQLSSRSNIRNTTTVLAMPTQSILQISASILLMFFSDSNLTFQLKTRNIQTFQVKTRRFSPRIRHLVANCKFRVSIAWIDDNLACFWLQTHHLQKPGAGLSGLVLVCFQFFKFAQRSQLNPQVSLSALQLNLIFFFS